MGRRGEMKSRRWRRQQQFFFGKEKCLTGATKIVVKELLFLLPCKLLKQLSHVSFFLGKNMGKAKLSWARNSFFTTLARSGPWGPKGGSELRLQFRTKKVILANLGRSTTQGCPLVLGCRIFFLPSSLGPPRKSENQKHFFGAVGGELEVILVVVEEEEEEVVGGIGISLSLCGSHFGRAKGS